MNNEMKRCANCGGEGEVLFSKKGKTGVKFWAECRNCHLPMNDRFEDEKAAIKAWNDKQPIVQRWKEGANK